MNIEFSHSEHNHLVMYEHLGLTLAAFVD